MLGHLTFYYISPIFLTFPTLWADSADDKFVIDSRVSLYRPLLSRLTAYLEMKIWSLFKRENLTTDIKIL